MKAKVTVESNFDPALPPVPIDPQRLEQVFLNLLLNAVQAMPQGGIITIRTFSKRLERWESARRSLFQTFHPGDELAVVTIRDHGVGISAEALPRVFDPFFTTKPAGVGTGLGLSMAKKIVELHDGAIELENAATGGVVAAIALKLKGGQSHEHSEKTHPGN